jgi:hypothetical protein
LFSLVIDLGFIFKIKKTIACSSIPWRPMMGAIGIKREATDISGSSKHPASTLSGGTSSINTSSFHTTRTSLSHTLVGIDLPNRGRGKGFMRKATLLKVLA